MTRVDVSQWNDAGQELIGLLPDDVVVDPECDAALRRVAEFALAVKLDLLAAKVADEVRAARRLREKAGENQ